MHRLISAAAAAIGLMTFASAATAAELQIDVTGLDFVYDGATLQDSNQVPVGGVPSDAINSVDFYLDGVLIESLNTADGDSLFADFLVNNVTGISTGGGSVTGGGGLFEVAFDAVPEDYLTLSFDSSTVFYTGGQIALNAVLTDISVLAQFLPVPYTYDDSQPIYVTFTGFIKRGTLTSNAGTVTGFNASGTASVVGQTAVPEPASLAVLAPAGLLLLRRRK